MNELLANYITVKDSLDHFKKREKELRIELLDKHFPNVVQGVKSTILDGFEIKGTFKLNYKLDLDALCEHRQYFTPEEEDCIVEKLSISVSKYNALSTILKEDLDECIITTNALPSIKITMDEDL